MFAVPLPDAPLPDDELPVPDAALELDELFDEVAVLCVEPGRTAATTPATATLAKLTVAVAVFAGAGRAHAPPRRAGGHGPRCGDALGYSCLSVWHTQL